MTATTRIRAWRRSAVATAAVLAAAALPADVAARPVLGGTLVMGRSVAGVRLGMGVPELRRRLGPPVHRSGAVLEYGRGLARLFDVVVDARGRVAQVLFSPAGFRVARGPRLSSRGALAAIAGRWHLALVASVDLQPVFRASARVAGRLTFTEFQADRPAITGRVRIVTLRYANS